MKNSQKGFILPLVLGIIALLVIGGGAYVYLNQHKNPETASTNENSNESVPPLQNFDESSTTTASTSVNSSSVNAGSSDLNKILKNNRLLSYAFSLGGKKLPFAYQFPNTDDNGANDYSPNISQSFYHIISIPFHNSTKILRVYLGNEYLLLAIYDSKNSSASILGKIKEVSFTGNSGGVFVPVAITADNEQVVLDAYMDSPGAGGGSVSYSSNAVSVNNPKLDSEGFFILENTSEYSGYDPSEVKTYSNNQYGFSLRYPATITFNTDRVIYDYSEPGATQRIAAGQATPLSFSEIKSQNLENFLDFHGGISALNFNVSVQDSPAGLINIKDYVQAQLNSFKSQGQGAAGTGWTDLMPIQISGEEGWYFDTYDFSSAGNYGRSVYIKHGKYIFTISFSWSNNILKGYGDPPLPDSNPYRWDEQLKFNADREILFSFHFI